MKSEKARELIEKYAIGNSRNEASYLLKRTAIRCVELAEQEAEERMRKKAVDVILIALGVWMFIDGYDNLQKK